MIAQVVPSFDYKSMSGCHLIQRSHEALIRKETENRDRVTNSLHFAFAKSLPNLLLIIETKERVDQHKKSHTVRLRIPRGNSSAYECSDDLCLKM